MKPLSAAFFLARSLSLLDREISRPQTIGAALLEKERHQAGEERRFGSSKESR
jgi:hypothetical protein